MRSFLSRSSEQTRDLGKSFSALLQPGDVVAISGTLGSGKTQFINGICTGLGVGARVTSPTFTIINEYDAPKATVVHIDLYRIGSERELLEIDLETYFRPECICLIEWAEKALNLLPPVRHNVKLSFGNTDNEREIEIRMKEEVEA